MDHQYFPPNEQVRYQQTPKIFKKMQFFEKRPKTTSEAIEIKKFKVPKEKSIFNKMTSNNLGL